VIITGIYTIAGGLHAIVYTEVLQMVIFTVGGITASVSTIQAVGGWDEMVKVFNDPSKPYLAEFPHVIRGTESDFSWTGMFFGQLLGSVWYWCIDQAFCSSLIIRKWPSGLFRSRVFDTEKEQRSRPVS
jgi:SSS family solute:Na+ symporter